MNKTLTVGNTALICLKILLYSEEYVKHHTYIFSINSYSFIPYMFKDLASLFRNNNLNII